MSRYSSDADSCSDDSFGWIDMEHEASTAAKKERGVEERTSDIDDESSDDSDATHFVPECNNMTVYNAGREQKGKLKENVTTKASREQVKQYSSESSDTAQFDADSDNRPVLDTLREEKSKSKGNNPMIIKNDYLKSSGTIDTVENEISEDSGANDSASESSGDSDRKELKPFTKGLLVKKERFSHALSDDSNIDSPLNNSFRDKRTTHDKIKENNRATLIEGVLLDSVQPLPFEIGANEDVWVVQCPYHVSESMLKGKTLNFNGISCAEGFESRVLLTVNPKPMNLLLPKSPGKLMSLTPTGHIIFKEKEMASQILHPVCNEDNITSLPTGMKIRHPLFGADISLVQRLCPPLQKRRKKKKHVVSDLGDMFCMNENKVLEAENGSKFIKNSDVSSLHKKKKKKMQLDEETITSCQDPGIKNLGLQLPSFHLDSNPKLTAEKNRKSYFMNACIQPELQQKKHRKIKHEPEEAVSEEITNFLPELGCVTPSKKRKHKHLEYSIEDDRHIAGKTPIFSQKRKKQKYERESSTLCGMHSTSDKTDEPSEIFAEGLGLLSQKKKKHHKYDGDFESKCLDFTYSKSNDKAVFSPTEKQKSSMVKNNFPEALTLDPMTDTLLQTIKKKKKKIKENDIECKTDYNVETNADVNNIPTKKKKKMKIENSEHHLGQLSGVAEDTKNNICDSISSVDLCYFDISSKKLHKKNIMKFEEQNQSPEFIGKKNTHGKFFKHTLDNSILKQESSDFYDPALTELQQKKKKKKKKVKSE